MQLTDVLRNVTLGAPLQWKNLQVFPLMHPNGHAPGYTLIDDLLELLRGQVWKGSCCGVRSGKWTIHFRHSRPDP